MLPVAGRPFIDWPLGQLRSQGFLEVVLLVGYRGDVLREHVGDGSRFGLRVTYSDDGPIRVGTLGAIRQALPLLGDPIPVLYGDTYLTLDFPAVVQAHRRIGAAMTMTVMKNDGDWDTSNAVVSGDRVVAYSKNPRPSGASWIDYGFSVVNATSIAASTGADLATLATELATANAVAAFPVSDRFYEIGTPESLDETDRFLRSHL
jgi:NDP-sugar pyrophosphorylase family protein